MHVFCISDTVGLKYRPTEWNYQRHQDGHDAPARTRSKSRGASQQEYNCRQRVRRQRAAQHGDQVGCRLQVVRNISDGPGKNQQDEAGHHEACAGKPGIDGLIQRQQTLPQRQGGGHQAAQQGRPHQHGKSVGAANDVGEGIAFAADKQTNDHGQYHR